MLRFLPFLIHLGSLLAATPSHLKPGALTAHIGEVFLVGDVLLVRYPHSSLANTTDTLRRVSGKLRSIADTIQAARARESKAPSCTHSLDLLQLLEDRVVLLRRKAEDADEDCSLHSVHSRARRGLPYIAGSASQFQFGAASDEALGDAQDHYHHGSSFAAENRRVINASCEKLERLHTHTEALLQHTDSVAEVVNSVVKQINQVNQYLLLDHALHVLNDAIESVTSAHQQVVHNMVDAAQGRVTPAMFPLHDLKRTIRIGRQKYGLQPLYSTDMSDYFYPLMESSLTPDAVLVHVPFQTADAFEVHEIVPFPFSARGAVLTLDMTPSRVLIDKDFTLYSSGGDSLLERCKESVFQRFYCSASLFVFLPVEGGVCEVALTRDNAAEALSLCPYKQLRPAPVFHKNFQGFHYFYVPQAFSASVICPEGTTDHRVVGHYAVGEACRVRSPNMTTYPSLRPLGAAASVSQRVFPLRSLENLHVSGIADVTNSPGSSSFASGIQRLPKHLHRHPLYPGMYVPLAVMFVSLVGGGHFPVVSLFCDVVSVMLILEHFVVSLVFSDYAC